MKNYKADPEESRPYVTTIPFFHDPSYTQAALIAWDPVPESYGVKMVKGKKKDKEEAVREAKEWAKKLNIEFRP